MMTLNVGTNEYVKCTNIQIFFLITRYHHKKLQYIALHSIASLAWKLLCIVAASNVSPAAASSSYTLYNFNVCLSVCAKACFSLVDTSI